MELELAAGTYDALSRAVAEFRLPLLLPGATAYKVLMRTLRNPDQRVQRALAPLYARFIPLEHYGLVRATLIEHLADREPGMTTYFVVKALARSLITPELQAAYAERGNYPEMTIVLGEPGALELDVVRAPLAHYLAAAPPALDFRRLTAAFYTAGARAAYDAWCAHNTPHTPAPQTPRTPHTPHTPHNFGDPDAGVPRIRVDVLLAAIGKVAPVWLDVYLPGRHQSDALKAACQRHGLWDYDDLYKWC